MMSFAVTLVCDGNQERRSCRLHVQVTSGMLLRRGEQGKDWRRLQLSKFFRRRKWLD